MKCFVLNNLPKRATNWRTILSPATAHRTSKARSSHKTSQLSFDWKKMPEVNFRSQGYLVETSAQIPSRSSSRPRTWPCLERPVRAKPIVYFWTHKWRRMLIILNGPFIKSSGVAITFIFVSIDTGLLRMWIIAIDTYNLWAGRLVLGLQKVEKRFISNIIGNILYVTL